MAPGFSPHTVLTAWKRPHFSISSLKASATIFAQMEMVPAVAFPLYSFCPFVKLKFVWLSSYKTGSTEKNNSAFFKTKAGFPSLDGQLETARATRRQIRKPRRRNTQGGHLTLASARPLHHQPQPLVWALTLSSWRKKRHSFSGIFLMKDATPPKDKLSL